MNLLQILQRPVPDHTLAREKKKNYRKYPLYNVGERNQEALVNIADHGLAGQSHYSRPTAAAGKPLKGVSPQVWLRRSVAERLADINWGLQRSAEAEEIFGCKVELFLEEGYRSLALQRQLYEEVFPALIRKQFPDMSDDKVAVRRDDLIAAPSVKSGLPSPHLTGGVFDICVRKVNPDMQHKADLKIDMNGGLASTSEVTNPDYFEHHEPRNKKERQAQANRRAFYWIMRGALLGDDPCFAVNPTEWWHWSYGDQLWAQLTDAPAAFLGAAPEPKEIV